MKKIIKITSIILIQTFLLLNYTCVYGDSTLSISQKVQSVTLAPKTYLGAGNFQQMYLRFYADYRNAQQTGAHRDRNQSILSLDIILSMIKEERKKVNLLDRVFIKDDPKCIKEYKVLIGIPTRNSANYIADAFSSKMQQINCIIDEARILKENGIDVSVVFSVNGTTDNTVQVLEQLKQEHSDINIEIIDMEKGSKILAMNAVAKYAKNNGFTLLYFVVDDVYFKKGSVLANIKKLLEQKKVSFISSAIDEIKPDRSRYTNIINYLTAFVFYLKYKLDVYQQRHLIGRSFVLFTDAYPFDLSRAMTKQVTNIADDTLLNFLHWDEGRMLVNQESRVFSHPRSSMREWINIKVRNKVLTDILLEFFPEYKDLDFTQMRRDTFNKESEVWGRLYYYYYEFMQFIVGVIYRYRLFFNKIDRNSWYVADTTKVKDTEFSRNFSRRLLGQTGVVQTYKAATVFSMLQNASIENNSKAVEMLQGRLEKNASFASQENLEILFDMLRLYIDDSWKDSRHWFRPTKIIESVKMFIEANSLLATNDNLKSFVDILPLETFNKRSRYVAGSSLNVIGVILERSAEEDVDTEKVYIEYINSLLSLVVNNYSNFGREQVLKIIKLLIQRLPAESEARIHFEKALSPRGKIRTNDGFSDFFILTPFYRKPVQLPLPYSEPEEKFVQLNLFDLTISADGTQELPDFQDSDEVIEQAI